MHGFNPSCVTKLLQSLSPYLHQPLAHVNNANANQVSNQTVWVSVTIVPVLKHLKPVLNVLHALLVKLPYPNKQSMTDGYNHGLWASTPCAEVIAEQLDGV